MSYCVATCAGEERPRRQYASASMFATGMPHARCSQASRLWALAHGPSARRSLRLPSRRGCCSARDSSGRSAPTVEPEASVKLCVRQGGPVGERREVAEAAGHGTDEQRTSSPPCAARGEGERGERIGGRGDGSRRRSAGGRERGEERGRSRHLYRATGRVGGGDAGCTWSGAARCKVQGHGRRAAPPSPHSAAASPRPWRLGSHRQVESHAQQEETVQQRRKEVIEESHAIHRRKRKPVDPIAKGQQHQPSGGHRGHREGPGRRRLQGRLNLERGGGLPSRYGGSGLPLWYGGSGLPSRCGGSVAQRSREAEQRQEGDGRGRQPPDEGVADAVDAHRTPAPQVSAPGVGPALPRMAPGTSRAPWGPPANVAHGQRTGGGGRGSTTRRTGGGRRREKAEGSAAPARYRVGRGEGQIGCRRASRRRRRRVSRLCNGSASLNCLPGARARCHVGSGRGAVHGRDARRGGGRLRVRALCNPI